MGRVTILGAGFMGSALTIPASDNGHRVSLWGTHLDGHLIAALREGRPHPKLGMALPPTVKTFTEEELQSALEGAELVINAVTSYGRWQFSRGRHPSFACGCPCLRSPRGSPKRVAAR